MTNKMDCLTCRFWDNQVDRAYGFCRRRSPVVNMAGIVEFQRRERLGELEDWESGIHEDGGYWPVTAHSDWCGEWEQAWEEDVVQRCRELEEHRNRAVETLRDDDEGDTPYGRRGVRRMAQWTE